MITRVTVQSLKMLHFTAFLNEFSSQLSFFPFYLFLFLFSYSSFLIGPGSSFYLVIRHYMSDILFIFLYIHVLLYIFVIMFAPPYNVYRYYNFIMHQVSTSLYQCCFNLNDISNYRSEVILNLLLLNYTVTYVILSSRVLRKITSFHDGTP